MPKIKDMAGAEVVLLNVGLAQRLRGEVIARLNADIEMLKANASNTLKPIDDDIDGLTKALKAWATANRQQLFGENQSIQITYGRVGFRKSTRISPLPKCKVADILAALKGLNAYSAIRVTEAIDRDALRAWSDSELYDVNAKRINKEVFYAKVDEAEIANQTAQHTKGQRIQGVDAEFQCDSTKSV